MKQMKEIARLGALAGVLSVASAASAQTFFQWDNSNPGPTSMFIAGGAGLGGGNCASPGDTCYAWTETLKPNGSGGASIVTLDNNHPAAGNLAWQTVPGAATFITSDGNGKPWVVDAFHNIYYWNGSQFVLWAGASVTSTQVTVFDPTKPFNIWTVDIGGTVYVNDGTISSVGSWHPVGAPAASAMSLSRVRFQFCFQGSTDFAIPIPFIAEQATGNIDIGTVDGNTASCTALDWRYSGGRAPGGSQTLGPDITIGTDRNLYGYHWPTSAWQFIAFGPPAGLYNIAVGPSGTWALDGSASPLEFEECGVPSGRGPTCVNYVWNGNAN